MIFVEILEKSTKELLKLIIQYSKVRGHKVMTQKSIILYILYTNNEQLNFEIKNAIPFMI